jgi:hypothetical protein
MLKDNPKLMEIYKEALRRMAESTQDNAYKKYMEARNNDFNGKNQAEIQALCEEVWARVRQKMGVVAKEQNIFIDGEIHHWNYPKYENPYDVLNPNQLTEPINRSIHTEVHQQTTSNASDPWKGPIDPNNRINVEPYEYPQPHK